MNHHENDFVSQVFGKNHKVHGATWSCQAHAHARSVFSGFDRMPHAGKLHGGERESLGTKHVVGG